MHFKPTLIALLLCVLCVLCAICGCNSLRFAPTEAQKQNSALNVEAARIIRDEGADAGAGVTEVALEAAVNTQRYFGLPQEPPEEPAKILATAAVDSVKRPGFDDIAEAAEEGLSLAAELAVLLGFGGLTLGGRSLVKWIALARQKAKGFEQIVTGNELLKKHLELNNESAAMEAFRQFQKGVQTGKTPELVAVTRTKAKEKLPIVTVTQNIETQS